MAITSLFLEKRQFNQNNLPLYFGVRLVDQDVSYSVKIFSI